MKAPCRSLEGTGVGHVRGIRRSPAGGASGREVVEPPWIAYTRGDNPERDAAMAEAASRKGRRGRRRSNPLERYAADILAKQLFLEDLAIAAVDFDTLAAYYPELTPEQLRGRLGIATKRALLEDVADIVLEPAEDEEGSAEQMRLNILDLERFAEIVHEEMTVEVM